MAPFYSGRLIGRQCVSGGRGAGCHVLCLMLCVVLKLQGCVEGLHFHLTTVLQGDTRESGLLIVSLRLGRLQVARIHRREASWRGFTGLKWQLHNSTLIRWTYTISQDKDLTLGGMKRGKWAALRKNQYRTAHFGGTCVSQSIGVNRLGCSVKTGGLGEQPTLTA